jgi:hypothetical protein
MYYYYYYYYYHHYLNLLHVLNKYSSQEEPDGGLPKGLLSSATVLEEQLIFAAKTGSTLNTVPK